MQESILFGADIDDRSLDDAVDEVNESFSDATADVSADISGPDGGMSGLGGVRGPTGDVSDDVAALVPMADYRNRLLEDVIDELQGGGGTGEGDGLDLPRIGRRILQALGGLLGGLGIGAFLSSDFPMNLGNVLGDALPAGIGDVVGPDLPVGAPDIVGAELPVGVASFVGESLPAGVGDFVGDTLPAGLGALVGASLPVTLGAMLASEFPITPEDVLGEGSGDASESGETSGQSSGVSDRTRNQLIAGTSIGGGAGLLASRFVGPGSVVGGSAAAGGSGIGFPAVGSIFAARNADRTRFNTTVGGNGRTTGGPMGSMATGTLQRLNTGGRSGPVRNSNMGYVSGQGSPRAEASVDTTINVDPSGMDDLKRQVVDEVQSEIDNQFAELERNLSIGSGGF